MENMDKTFPTPYPELNYSEKLLEISGSSIIILACAGYIWYPPSKMIINIINFQFIDD
jgi:hypothetical protein